MNTIKILFFFLFISPSLFSQSIDGRWQGSISFLGSELKIITKFAQGQDSVSGYIDIPAQGIKDYPLSSVKITGNSVSFILPGPAPANFKGGYINKDSIYGDFLQAGIIGTFGLSAIEEVIDETKKEEPKPYKEEEVNFKNGDITFAGTLSLPASAGKHPAVVLITGSGAQTRDEEIVGFKIFGMIADHLTRNGIAVLRYDDRNTGKSDGPSVNQSTTEEFAEDVRSAVNFLSTRDDIDVSKIGLLGHSEGGLIAPMVAANDNSIAFIILMAGPGVKGIDIIKEQTRLIMSSSGGTESDIAEALIMFDAVYQASLGLTDWKSVEDIIKADALKEYDTLNSTKKDINKEEFISSYVNMYMIQMNNNWMKFFLNYDPINDISRVKTTPVLAVFGGKDLQVPPHQSEQPIRDALIKAGNTNYKIVTIPTANHLFQCADTGSPAEYARLKKEFCPGFLEEVTSFIKENTK